MWAARRTVLLAFAGLLVESRLATAKRAHLPIPQRNEKTTFVNIVGSTQNPYDKWWSKGGELCATAFKSPYKLLQCEGDFGKTALDLLSSAIAETNGNLILNVSATPEKDKLKSLADICASHRVYFVTQNNLPPAVQRPWALGPYYVAHIGFDQREAGLKTGRHLIASISGQGGILAFGAAQNELASVDRLTGLHAALSSSSNCYLLQPPVYAEWAASTAYDIMRHLIAEHGKKIKGVWAANDDMALGAIEALQLYGLIVPVTGMDGNKQAINAIQNRQMSATVAWDSFWQGGIGLALAMGAKKGLIDIPNEPHAHRAFYASFDVVTADNVQSFVEYRDAARPIVDWQDFWGRANGAIPD